MREELTKIDAEGARIRQPREELEKQQREMQRPYMEMAERQTEIDQQWVAIIAERGKMRSKEKMPEKSGIKPTQRVHPRASSADDIRARYPKTYAK